MVVSKYTSNSFDYFPRELIFEIMSYFSNETQLEEKYGIERIVLYGKGQATIFYNELIAGESRYTGEILGARRHGQGRLIYKDVGTTSAPVFEGSFDNNLRIRGKYCFAEGSFYEGTLSRDINASHQGIFVFPKGSRYEGDLRCDSATKNFIPTIKDGFGKFFSFKGYRYVGQWKNDKKSGKGIQFYSSGDIYEGEYDDVIHGFGTMKYFSSGVTYVGEWRRGYKHGPGTQIFPHGDKYVGEWVNDRLERGVLTTTQSNDRYEGEFKDGKKNGKGTLYYESGNRYEGDWKDDKRHGRGISYYASGNAYESGWVDDVCLRDGKFYSKAEVADLLATKQQQKQQQ